MIAAIEIASTVDVKPKFRERFVKIKSDESMIKYLPREVLETECVLVIVVRSVSALATRLKQVVECADSSSLLQTRRHEVRRPESAVYGSALCLA
jgi:hypothetical protein